MSKVRSFFIFLILNVFLFSFGPVYAIDLKGVLKQGGVLVGRTIPGATVRLEDQTVQSSSDGTFVIGLSRHHPKESILTVNLLGGIEEKHPLTIKQRTYKTQKIKGVLNKHVNPHAAHMPQIISDKKEIINARSVKEPLPFVWEDFMPPVKTKRITGVYGSNRTYNGEERNWHKGVDFAAPTGTPVFAPASGKIRLALENSFFNGNLIILDHGYQLMTVYAHLNKMYVKKGDEVKKGDIIGEVGTTGRSTGPHLHWGVYLGELPLDPMTLIERN